MTGLFTRYLHFVHLLPGKLLRQFCGRRSQAILPLDHLLHICGTNCCGCGRPHKLVRHHPLKCCCAHGGCHCWWSCLYEQIGNRAHVHGGGAWWHMFRFKAWLEGFWFISCYPNYWCLKGVTCCRSCQQVWKLAGEWCWGGAWNLKDILLQWDLVHSLDPRR